MPRYAAKKKQAEPREAGLFQLPFSDFLVAASPHLSRPDHLRTIVELFEAIDRGESLREVHAAPVQHGKTVTMMHGIAWLLGRHPEWPIIYATYAQQFSAANSREIRRIYTECGGALQEDFNTIQEWHTGHGGFLLATSPDGTATGKSARVFLIDDPFKNREEAESTDERNKRWEWFRSVALTRQSPKSTYAIIASRYHEDDLSGRCVTNLKWPYKRLAAINDDGQDPTRELGAALCPNGPDPEAPRDLAFLNALKEEIGDYEFESLCQGRPRPRSGACFKDAQYIDEIPWSEVVADAHGLDLAYSDSSTSDKTALVYLVRLKDGRVCVANVSTWQKSIADTVPLLRIQLNAKPKAMCASYISGNEKGHIETLASEEPPIYINAMPARYNKLFRAQATARAWNAGKVFVLKGQTWTAEFVGRVCGFDGRPGGKDDEVDAMVAGHDLLVGTGEQVRTFGFAQRRC